MESLECELKIGIDLLDDKIKRVEVISQIIESVSELARSSKTHSQVQDLEEYYMSQINRWMAFGEKKTRQMEEQEVILLETQRKYLGSLKRIKELEDEMENVKEKYLHYKTASFSSVEK
ncbi:hypothetical protein NEMIN01_2030 [Nematocida minor]|uniref:uncharacterized protein n=1 Tax=Nematocida minor TaxID=1912983 RepID=UPI00221F0122|nr:uncharacterized protein NEMIN01_2030 [Nematocida minor]KAI5192466.1 hypothetical protein NEMIN01_2030 [Nematocida minor]